MDKSQKDVTQSEVEGNLFAFDQSQEVFYYALHRSPLDRLTIAVLNLITFSGTLQAENEVEAYKRNVVTS